MNRMEMKRTNGKRKREKNGRKLFKSNQIKSNQFKSIQRTYYHHCYKKKYSEERRNSTFFFFFFWSLKFEIIHKTENMDGFWLVTYTGEESHLIRVSPVVDSALKFRGQLNFRLSEKGSEELFCLTSGSINEIKQKNNEKRTQNIPTEDNPD